MAMPDRISKRLLVAAGVVMLGLVGACRSGEDAAPEPSGAAEQVAAAISAGDFADVAFVAGTTSTEVTEAFSAVVEGMGDARPSAVVGGIVVDPEDETLATAVLDVVWPLDEDREWAYETEAELTLVEGEDDEDDRWALEWTPSVIEPSLEPGERFTRERIVPERGDILGLDDQPIVVQRPVQRIGIDKTRVDPAGAADSAFALATALDLDDPGVYRDRVVASGSGAFVEAITVRDDGSFPLDIDRIDGIQGSSRISDELLLAPTREFARPILGTSGDATAERIEESGGRLEVGDTTGISGLQLAAEDQLAGQMGVIVGAVTDDEAAQPREVFRLDAVRGQTLRTSFDVTTQLAAEGALAAVDPPSALVAIRPSTGQIIAAASGPGSQGFSTATLGQYAPGSTFKVVSSLALLRSGLTPESPVECPPTIDIDGRAFKNYGDYPASRQGAITLRDAVANSCNTAMIGAGRDVPQDALTAAGRSLGLGAVADVGVPHFEGAVPPEAGPVQHAASMIGQDRVLASPLGMASVAASVAAGRQVLPNLVQGDQTAATTDIDESVTPAEAAQLRAMMEAVVSEGSANFLADLDGPPAGAKTGTAEYGTDVPPRTHAWMIAFQGDLAVSVFVEDGAGGSSTAGPILEQFLRAVAVTG